MFLLRRLNSDHQGAVSALDDSRITLDGEARLLRNYAGGAEDPTYGKLAISVSCEQYFRHYADNFEAKSSGARRRERIVVQRSFCHGNFQIYEEGTRKEIVTTLLVSPDRAGSVAR